MKSLLRLSSHQTTFSLLRSLALALGIFISRLGMLPANVSPLGSFGFAGGASADSAPSKSRQWWQVGLFAVSILVFDLFVGGTYRGALFTYLGFMLYPLLGWWARRSVRHQLLALPAASFGFFLFSNGGVWWYWYDHTLLDLGRCFILAAPFYTRTLVSDLGFGYGWMAVRYLIKNRNMLSMTIRKYTHSQPAVQTTA